MYKLNGKVLRMGRGFIDNNGIQHPSNWGKYTEEEKAALGLIWEDEPAPYDSRFYWSADVPKALEDKAEVDEDGNPILDEKGEQVITKGLKSTLIAKVKDQAGGLLSPTDWMIIKSQETGELVPDAILAYRAEVRAASNSIEAAITGVTTIEELIALHETPVDADGNATGNAPIADWPEM